jgi:hypothetical protein
MGRKLTVSLFCEEMPGIRNTAQAFDISPTGLILQTSVPLTENQRIQLELPTSLGNLCLSALVTANRENRWACQFVDIVPRTASLLSQWLFPPFEP